MGGGGPTGALYKGDTIVIRYIKEDPTINWLDKEETRKRNIEAYQNESQKTKDRRTLLNIFLTVVFVIVSILYLFRWEKKLKKTKKR